MPINFKPKDQVKRSYHRFVLNGIGSIGKSTALATISKKPLVVDFDGRFPKELVDKSTFLDVKGDFKDLMQNLNDILNEPKVDFDWLIFDTATKVMACVEEFTIQKDCAGSKEKYNAYGHGLKFSPQYFKEILDVIDAIQAKHKINVGFICHTKVKDFKNPMTENYSKNVLDLPDAVADRLKQWADYIGYAFFEIEVDKEKHKAKGESKRIITFNDNPLYEAKNSSAFPLPAKIDFDKAGAWADVVFGKTQAMLEEVRSLVNKFPKDKQKEMLELMEKTGVFSYGVDQLKEFIEHGKKQLAKLS